MLKNKIEPSSDLALVKREHTRLLKISGNAVEKDKEVDKDKAIEEFIKQRRLEAKEQISVERTHLNFGKTKQEARKIYNERAKAKREAKQLKEQQSLDITQDDLNKVTDSAFRDSVNALTLKDYNSCEAIVIGNAWWINKFEVTVALGKKEQSKKFTTLTSALRSVINGRFNIERKYAPNINIKIYLRNLVNDYYSCVYSRQGDEDKINETLEQEYKSSIDNLIESALEKV